MLAYRSRLWGHHSTEPWALWASQEEIRAEPSRKLQKLQRKHWDGSGSVEKLQGPKPTSPKHTPRSEVGSPGRGWMMRDRKHPRTPTSLMLCLGASKDVSNNYIAHPCFFFVLKRLLPLPLQRQHVPLLTPSADWKGPFCSPTTLTLSTLFL